MPVRVGSSEGLGSTVLAGRRAKHAGAERQAGLDTDHRCASGAYLNKRLCYGSEPRMTAEGTSCRRQAAQLTDGSGQPLQRWALLTTEKLVLTWPRRLADDGA